MRQGRNYELFIQIDGRTVLVRPPIRVSFAGDKSIAGGLNRLDLTVYNLERSKRLAVAKDPDDQKYVPLQFSVGYGDKLEPLFRGSVFVARNRQEGADILTEIECVDGGFDYQFSETDRTVDAGGDPVRALLSDMLNTEAGAIAPRQPLIRPRVMSGRTPRVLDQIIGNGESWFIQDERLNILGPDQVVAGEVPLVSASTGLIETPTREQQVVTFKTLFNPAVRVGALLELESLRAPHINGTYQARTITYDGDLDGETWEQTVTAFPQTRPESIRG